MKRIAFIAQTKADLSGFPRAVKTGFGYALFLAQNGGKHPKAVAMKDFAGASVLEVRFDHAGDTYRLVYTTKGGAAISVLHAFMKKSTRGLKTPKTIIDTIKARLKMVR